MLWTYVFASTVCYALATTATESPRNKSANKLSKKTNCHQSMLKYNNYTDIVSWHQQNILCKKLRRYKGTERPTNQGGPVVVRTHISIDSIGALQEASMEFTVQYRFQQKWYDTRLTFARHSKARFDYVFVSTDQTVWMPDTFFQNEKFGYGHLIDKPNLSIKIRHDGLVIYDRRLTMTFACLMDFKRYPRDSQFCYVEFSSYAHTINDIDYVWEDRPIIIGPHATSFMLKFHLNSFDNESCTSNTTTGTYSCLRVKFTFDRVFSHYFLTQYIPSIMLVAVSYVSYWIDWKAAPGRVPLSILTILGMIVQSNIINANLPPVSYIKAIDVWTTTCLTLAFASLLEYAFVNYTGVMEQRRTKARKRHATTNSSNTHTVVYYSASCPPGVLLMQPIKEQAGDYRVHDDVCFTYSDQYKSRDTSGERQDIDVVLRRRRKDMVLEEDQPPLIVESTRRKKNIISLFSSLRKQTRADRIDFAARVLVPIVFCGFNAVYWTVFW